MSTNFSPSSASSTSHHSSSATTATTSANSVPALSASFAATSITPPCPTLTDLCLQYYRQHIEELGNLHQLPEPLVQQLLYLIYVDGGLTPNIIKLFAQSDHDSIQEWIDKNIQLDRAYLINATSNCRASRF